MPKNATEALDTCVKAMKDAAESFPVKEAGKWQIGDDLLGRDGGGKHTKHYAEFLDTFKRNIDQMHIPFEKYEEQLVKLSMYMGALARFQADAARPGGGDIRQAEVDFAVAFAKKECHLLRMMIERAREAEKKEGEVREIWCY